MSCPLHSNDNSCAGCAKVKIQRLERQLAEARELVIDTYQEGWNDNRNNIDCWETHWIDSDSRYSLERLKENGE